MFTRKCPICNKELKYGRKPSLKLAIDNNTPCRHCSKVQTWKNPKYVEKMEIAFKKRKPSFLGKRHTEETKKLLSDINKGKKQSVETCEKKRKYSTENNPMKGRTVYSVWLFKFGKEEADRRMETYKAKQSVNNSGRRNAMYGKPCPNGSGNGYKGWYKKIFFRSLRELSYLITLEGKIWKNGELVRIPYIDYLGRERTYSPDFIIDEKIIIEIKPLKLHKSPNVILKKKAAEKYCQQHNMTYHLIDFERIPVEELKLLVDSGDVVFQERYHKKFLEFLLNPKKSNRT